jgi:hypothetical protein
METICMLCNYCDRLKRAKNMIMITHLVKIAKQNLNNSDFIKFIERAEIRANEI